MYENKKLVNEKDHLETENTKTGKIWFFEAHEIDVFDHWVSFCIEFTAHIKKN